jgi:hypothetical protein
VLFWGLREPREKKRREYRPRGIKFPDTYQTVTSISLSWDLFLEVIEEPLLEQNPFVDQIHLIPEVSVCHWLCEGDEQEPSKQEPSMGWVEYMRRQRLCRLKRATKKTALRKAIVAALARDGFSLRKFHP